MRELHHTREQIDAYLDEETTEASRNGFLAHDNDCESCRAQVESRRTLIRAVREARPEFRASCELRRKVAALDNAMPGQSRRSLIAQWRDLFSSPNWLANLRPRLVYVWLLAVITSATFAIYVSQRQAHADRLIETAIDTHEHRLTGTVPVEFRSASAREVTRWCNARLHFAFRLPTYQDDSGDRSKYKLIGASLIRFRGKDAASIAYRLGEEQLSLLVVSDKQAVASGGEITRAKSLVFHSIRRNGLEVLTWSVHHVTYALVSDVDLPPQQSCVVCHANPRDRLWQQSFPVHRTSSFTSDRTLAKFSH